MTKQRKNVTVEEVAANPVGAFQITPRGEVEIKSLRIIDGDWTYIEYVSGGSCAGEPKHWHSYVRYE